MERKRAIENKKRYFSCSRKKDFTMIANVITISPEIQSGTPVFAGTRVPIKNLFDYLKGGDTIEEFLNDFPSVKKEQVNQLLEFVENFVTFNTSPYEKSAA